MISSFKILNFFYQSELDKCSWSDVGLKKWMVYHNDLFSQKNSHSFFKLIYLLKNNNEQLDFDDNNLFDCDDFRFAIFPNLGFFEKYLLIFINDDKKYFSDASTALMLAIFYGVIFSEINRTTYKKSLSEVLEKAFLESNHECFGIDDIDLLNIMVNKKIIDKKSMLYLSFARGLILGERYKGFKHKLILFLKKIFFYVYMKII